MFVLLWELFYYNFDITKSEILWYYDGAGRKIINPVITNSLQDYLDEINK